MREIKAVIQPYMLDRVLHALTAIEDLPGVTVSQVQGWGQSRATRADHAVQAAGHAFANMTKLEIVVPVALAPRVVEAIANAARTGRPGDGKVFESEVSRVISIRTGDEDQAAV